MRRFLPLALLLILAAPARAASEEARWVRYPAISPDGKTIVFAHRGDLWLVASAGGDARRLTTHEALETRPVWSPDGTQIAFASNRHGDFDVFVVSAAGGTATRLTWHDADDFPCDFEPDGSRVLFTSARQDDPAAILPSSRIPELWSVPVSGGRPRLEITTPAEWARVSPDGAGIAYEDRRGYEDTWRKHHVSPVTRDIWGYVRATGEHTRLTSFGGEDRNPVWSPDGKWLYYLSEAEGTFNVWRGTPDGADRLTSHDTHPVRFLSCARDGALCYGWNGQVFTWREGRGSARVPIRIAADERENPVRRETTRRGATEMAPSPDGEEVAFVVRGDVFVASVEHGSTRRVTRTVEQERSVCWAPDGKSLYYASERTLDDAGHASWNLYRTRLARPDDERFHRATLLEEDVVLADAHETFQPLVSPDGKKLAFVRDRDEVCLLDLATKAVRTLVPAERNYSYTDGDVSYDWSPDSRWLAVTYLPNRSWIDQVGVVDVETGVVRDVTQSGYGEGHPRFTRDGRALYFVSDRLGRRAHGSWGSDQDVLAFDLNRAAADRARLSEEDFDRLREKEKKERQKKERKEKGGEGQEGDEDAPQDGDGERPTPTPEPVEIDFDDVQRRQRRVTLHSAPIADYVVSNDGEACLYLAEMDGKFDVWLVKPRAGETRRLVRLGDGRGGDLALSRDGKTLFVRTGDGRILKADVGGALSSDGRRGRGGEGEGGGRGGFGGGGGADAEPVAYAAELEVDAVAERRHLLEHMWRQAGQKFYKADLHGADWPALRENYMSFLDQIENDMDFAELASELLGELNASHTGCRWRPEGSEGDDETASLGLLFDVRRDGEGLVVAEVLKNGPCDRADSKIAAGHVLQAIDGVALDDHVNPWRLLDHQAGKRLRLAFGDPASAETYEEVVRPISGGEEGRLLYERLLERRRKIVEELSGGRLGYVHVAGMNDASFRHLYQEALGRNADKEGLIVDTRFNGGGWLHDDLVVFLSGKRYMDFVPRGKERGNMGGEPLQRWARPSCVLISEGNYSDAHLFPVAYRIHGIGKLVGAPVAGTGTAVWWERLMDPALVFGIPQVGMVDAEGRYMENLTLEPDVLVLTDPAKIAQGEDEQLEAAVRTLLPR